MNDSPKLFARWILALAFLGCFSFFALFWFALGRDPHTLPSALIDRPTPHFYLPDLRFSNRFFDETLFRGRVSVLRIWASWCEVCRRDHSEWMRISRQNNVPIYGLNYKDNPSIALRWIREDGVPDRVVLFDRDGHFAMDLGVYGAPETFVIDRAGVIRYRYVGQMTQEVWNSLVLPRIRSLEDQ